MPRSETLHLLASKILALPAAHPQRVAIDGIDASGKTTLGNELCVLVAAAGRPVVRASLDDFHRPRAERMQRGELSAEGCYYDTFDYPSLRSVLLDPLGPGGDRYVRSAVFDYRTDSSLEAPKIQEREDCVLIFDGVFLLRPELSACWDRSIYVRVSFDTALERALERDRALFGSPELTRLRYEQRYFPAQRLYWMQADPLEQATWVVDNNDISCLSIVRENNHG